MMRQTGRERRSVKEGDWSGVVWTSARVPLYVCKQLHDSQRGLFSSSDCWTLVRNCEEKTDQHDRPAARGGAGSLLRRFPSSTRGPSPPLWGTRTGRLRREPGIGRPGWSPAVQTWRVLRGLVPGPCFKLTVPFLALWLLTTASEREQEEVETDKRAAKPKFFSLSPPRVTRRSKPDLQRLWMDAIRCSGTRSRYGPGNRRFSSHGGLVRCSS